MINSMKKKPNGLRLILPLWVTVLFRKPELTASSLFWRSNNSRLKTITMKSNAKPLELPSKFSKTALMKNKRRRNKQKS